MVVVSASLLAISLQARAASFDCAKAKAAVEKMICSDRALSDLDGRLASAYRRALVLAASPESQKAEQRAWLTTERKKCADVACLTQVYQKRLTALEAAAPPGKEIPFSFTRAPFINPKIIDDLLTGESDEGDQVVAINLTDSETADRYFCDIKTNKAPHEYPHVYFKEEEEGSNEPAPEFGYRYIGQTTSGVDVLFTSSSGGGGSGVFERLILVRLVEESGAPSYSPASGKAQTITFRKKRLVIKKLGEIVLGDRWNGSLKVSGNEIVIGKDVGFFSDREKTPGWTVKVDASP